MTYKKGLVAVLKFNGKVLREDGDRIQLPFGAEYTIMLKNLDTVRIQAKIEIDGQQATEGTWLVVEPHSSIEVERFIKNGNMQKGNRFKFIERTAEVEAGRGIEAEDGLIRIEFKRELVQKVEHHTIHHYDHVYQYPKYWPHWPDQPHWNHSFSGTLQAQNNVSYSGAAPELQEQNCNEAGITVPGSESDQKFQNVAWFATEEQSEIIVLKIVGRKEGSSVVKAVTVDVKPVCTTCKRRNKSGSKFCSGCGTSLNII